MSHNLLDTTPGTASPGPALPTADDIFCAAIELAAPAQRAAYIHSACSGDEKLLREVQELVEAYFQAGDFLEAPAGILTGAVESVLQEAPGEIIGSYKLLEQIGEGGFAVVFMAEQQQPVRRKIAIKIIKAGMDTKQVVARFEAERQALAMMDHPSLAKVFDAGATQTGRPYFVMELVKGVPITRYCDEHDLNIGQRIDLFAQVCQAVQHAHQKGIIHRDIKPTNVLVSTHDDRPLAKVIDFGIAKATETRLTEKTLFTDFHQLIGTPAYMSPEQADGNLDIDTRSDVYSLGVLLYELLAGSPPFDPKELRSKAFAEMQRIIREVEPPTPSARIASQPLATQSAAALHRQSDLKRLPQQLRGELDWIVMRSLEKDRNRRYQTAAALADDLARYRADQPVEARRPSRRYRLKKFIRRNRKAVFASAAMALVVLIGLVLSSIGFFEARRQAGIAGRQAARSEQVTKVVQDMLAAAAPSAAMGRDTSLLREILDKTAIQVEKDLNDQPDVQAELRSIIGDTYFAIGRDKDAIDLHRKSLAYYREFDPGENATVAVALAKLAQDLRYVGKIEEAESLVRQSLGIWPKLRGEESPEMARTMSLLAIILLSYGNPTKSADAEVAARQALSVQRRVLGSAHPETGHTLTRLALALLGQQKDGEAEIAAREAVSIYRQSFGEKSPQTAQALHVLSQTISARKPQEAEVLERESLAMRRNELHGIENHPDLAYSLEHLAEVLARGDKLAEAEQLFREAWAIRQNVFGNDDPGTRWTLESLLDVLRREGKSAEAENLRRQFLESKSVPQSKEPVTSMPPFE